MSNNNLKVDVRIESSVLVKSFGSLENYLKEIIKQALEEAGEDIQHVNPDQIAKEASYIKFEVCNIPFTVKVD